ncbi:MAG: hypothetical protein ACE5G8_09485, partial [Anaerolineae bacterium]
VCANGSNISLVEGSRAVYCYRVTNTSVVTLSLHTLSDNRLGTLLSGAFFELGPGQSYAFITATTILTDTVNTATWTANNADGTLSLPPVATDAATVTVLASSRFKTYLPLVIKP